jgi:CDP-glucose 4,6-dehydratase
MGGFDPYSSSKACAELVTAAWRNSFFQGAGSARRVALASVRAGNVIGGGDWAVDRLIPDCVRAFEVGRPASIRQPDAVRPWQHVLDPLHGYMLLAEMMWERGGAFAESWNFGPAEDEARPVGWIVDRMVKLWGGNASWRAIGGEQFHEAASLRIDSAKARARLDWRPRLSLETGLDWTVEWYSRMTRSGARCLTIEQISRYETLIGGA